MRDPDPEKKKALRAELQETKLPEKFAMLEKRLEKTKFLCGDELTLADLSVYVMLNWVGMGVLDGVNKDCIPQVSQAHQPRQDHQRDARREGLERREEPEAELVELKRLVAIRI